MTWLTRHRVRRYLRSSLFLAPTASIVLALAVAPVVRWVDDQTRWTLLGFGAPAGRPPSSRASPRRSSPSSSSRSASCSSRSRSPAGSSRRGSSPASSAPVSSRSTLSAFVFSYTYSLAALSRIGERVPQLPVALAIVASLASLGHLHLPGAADRRGVPARHGHDAGGRGDAGRHRRHVSRARSRRTAGSTPPSRSTRAGPTG